MTAPASKYVVRVEITGAWAVTFVEGFKMDRVKSGQSQSQEAGAERARRWIEADKERRRRDAEEAERAITFTVPFDG